MVESDPILKKLKRSRSKAERKRDKRRRKLAKQATATAEHVRKASSTTNYGSRTGSKDPKRKKKKVVHVKPERINETSAGDCCMIESEKDGPAQLRMSGKEITLSAGATQSNVKTDLVQTPIQGTLSDRLNPGHPFFDAELKANWKIFSKKKRAEMVRIDQDVLKARNARTANIKHPFKAKSEDHCESPVEAYEDIAPVLELLAKSLGKTKKTLKIYDPYFCAGTVIQNLASLGFDDVYNRCEDFYKVLRENRLPKHDVLVTNPPYTEHHVKKLLRLCGSTKKPFLLLLPNHFCKKNYYLPSVTDGGREEPSYLCPGRGRYMYWTPKGLHRKNRTQNHASSKGFRTSPFVSFWYIDLSPAVAKKELLSWWHSRQRQIRNSKEGSAKVKSIPMMCASSDELPKASRPKDLHHQ